MSDKIKEELKRNFGFKDDEIETLFKTDEELLAFYNDSKKLSGVGQATADGDEAAMADTYKLDEVTKRDLQQSIKVAVEQRKQKVKEAKEKFDQTDQSIFPETERVSFKDYLKNLKKGDDVL